MSIFVLAIDNPNPTTRRDMTRYLKSILTMLAVLIVSFSFSQKPVVYFFSGVGLTLYISPEFTVLDAE